MLIGRAELCGLIPHGEGMCMLDGVSFWDAKRIVCHTETHLKSDHPLLDGNGLSAVHTLEYGAQAMAVHGALLARAEGRIPFVGWLASINDARFEVERIDTIETALQVEARSVLSGNWGASYDIFITAAGRPIASARVLIAAKA